MASQPVPTRNNDQPRSTAHYIPTLDGWRCIAISLVLFAHIWRWLEFGTTKLAHLLHYPGVGVHIERSGVTGVAVFFCISGFLITRRVLDQGTSLTSFYVRRAFRILPAALVYLLCIALLAQFGVIAASSREILACLFFYRNYFDRIAWFTGHFWSLSIEEQFYLFWPTLLAVAGVARSRWLAVAGIAGIAIWRQMHWPLPDFVYFHTDMRLDAILCGVVLALSWPSWKVVVERAPRFTFPVVAAAFIAADVWSNQLQGFTDLIQSILVCVLIAGTVVHPTRLVSRILEIPFVAWIGRMSYSIYLWQQLFLRPAGAPHWQLPLRLGAILGLAWLSYRFVERPMIAAGRRLLTNRNSRHLAAVR